MLSLILQALYGAVDLMVVGHFGSVSSVSAVATGSQVMHAITVIVTGLTMGVTVALGHSIGAGNTEKAGGIVAGQIKLFIGVAITLTVIMVVFAGKAAKLMHVPEEAYEQTVEYIQICSSGMIFITAYNAISGVFRGIGNSKSPFYFVLVACILNIILDLIFVGYFKMDSKGAALATIISQACSVVFSLIYIRKITLPFKVTKKSFTMSQTIATITKIGAPISLQDFLIQVSFLMITSIVNSLGLVASASIGISEKLFIFLAMAPMAFMSAISAFTAQNMGAKQEQRAKDALKIAIKISLVFGAFIFLALVFRAEWLANIFTNDESVIKSAASYLRGTSVEYLTAPFLFCLLGFFNGCGRTTFVMTQSLISAFIVRVPLSFFFSRIEHTSMFIIGWAVPISAMVSLSICLIYYAKVKGKLRIM